MRLLVQVRTLFASTVLALRGLALPLHSEKLAADLVESWRAAKAEAKHRAALSRLTRLQLLQKAKAAAR